MVSKNTLSKQKLSVLFTILLIGLALFFNVANAQISGNSEAQEKLVTTFEVNGLKVIVKKRAASPTVSANIFFRGGVRNTDKATAGIENLLLNVASEGSVRFPRAILRKELSKTGSQIGGGATLDFSVLSLASTRQNFEQSWQIFTDVALNPQFSKDDFERIQQQLLTGLKSQEDEPEGFLQVFKDRVVYENHPYSNPPSGTISSVNGFSVDSLKKYHSNMMQTSKMLIVIVGDVDPIDLKDKITKSFGSLPRGSYLEKPIPQIPFSKPTLDISSKSLPTNYIQGEFPAPNLSSNDYFAMRVATKILQGRVFEEVRVKRNLSYAPNADMGELNANTANIYVTAVDANRSISVMLAEIAKLKEEPVGEREISGVAGGFLTTYFIGQETNSAQAAELARYELTGGGWKNSLGFLEGVKKVSDAQIKAVANKYMKNIRFVVVGNPAAISKEIFLQK